MATYNLRRGTHKNYKQLGDIKLPRASRIQPDKDRLYDVTVLEEDGDKVKIHYNGYGEEFDEWRQRNEIQDLTTQTPMEMYRPFELHRELAMQIKLSLNSKNRRDPDVRIEVPFDKMLFEGGLKQSGHYLGRSHGHDVYGIDKYSDLSHLMGATDWYIRGLNERLNFCYANKNTVQYYLHRRQPIEHFTPTGKQVLDMKYILVFKFVRMDGVKSDWEYINSLD